MYATGHIHQHVWLHQLPLPVVLHNVLLHLTHPHFAPIVATFTVILAPDTQQTGFAALKICGQSFLKIFLIAFSHVIVVCLCNGIVYLIHVSAGWMYDNEAVLCSWEHCVICLGLWEFFSSKPVVKSNQTSH